MSSPQRRFDVAGATALLIGATGIGLAPILVRLSETGPVATAFYRLLLAQPIIWLLLKREQSARVALRALGANQTLANKITLSTEPIPKLPLPQEEGRGEGPAASPARSNLWYAAIAGLFFTADLSIWHWSLQLTTVANSTFVTNLTPFFVTIAVRILYRERVTRRLMLGMTIGFAGGFLLIAESFHLESRFLIGDFLALLAAIFYSGYLIVVKRLRRDRSTWYVMAWTGIFAAPTMFIISALSRETLLPKTPFGWSIVIALALVSQIGGQGLIAYGLAHISASVSAVMLMWQPVVAALLAWWILHEPLTPLRIAGGLVIIVGIVIATSSRREPQRR
jgi:drug/metabolite transporter (DMT)-like permease